MKILFISRNEYMEPLGIMQLSGFLKKHGHQCLFMDVVFEKDPIGEVRRISPDILAYSITTGKHKFYQKLNCEIKKRIKVFSLFGGPHCTFFPEFINEDGVDAICRGEGEFAFLELADALASGKDITRIQNLWVKTGNAVHKNQVRDLVGELDTLPFLDRELLDKYNHYKLMHRRFFLTGRGCPYKCTYCFNHSYNKLYQDKGAVVRKRSVANLIDEIRAVKEVYHPKRIQFMDDTFNIDPRWTLEFCAAYKKEIGIPFGVIIRMNLLEERSVKALREAGCIRASVGLESGNEHIRNDILKRGMSEKQILSGAALLNKYGIKIMLQNIVGLPDETLEMAFQTLGLNIKCRPVYSWVSIFQPYPKTELCDYSREKGYFDSNVDAFGESFFTGSVMKIKDIAKIERLGHLFSLGVAFPALLPLIRLLIKLPLDKFYRLLWVLHRTKCYLFDLRFIDLSEFFIRK